MTPRIPVDDLGLDRHGAIDHKALERADVRDAVQRYDELVKLLDQVKPPLVEIARLCNAQRQECHV